MQNFILPVIIDNRKSVLLDLNLVLENSTDKDDFGEDIYILEIPLHENTILSISKHKSIQSLITNQLDLPLKDLKVNFSEITNGVKLAFSQNTSSGMLLNLQKVELEKGLSLRFDDLGDDVLLHFEKSTNYNGVSEGAFELLMNLNISDKNYQTRLKFYYSKSKNIILAGLDFGSEASQIMDGVAENLRTNTFDLFEAIKKVYYPSYDSKGVYIQREIDNNNLYRSIFYAKKKFDDELLDIGDDIEIVQPENNLDLISKQTTVEQTNFFEDWMQIPNLKLIGESNQLGNNLSFQVLDNKIVLNKSLNELKDPIYAGLLESMIRSYLKAKIHKSCFLRFTLLVPNIYDIEKVNNVKKIVRHIINKLNIELESYLQGVEISTLSESDAAFMGCMGSINIKPGKYYIVIDCGKGTTDFSIIKAEANSLFKSEYRNGFAGAGNLISFSIMQSVLVYLKRFSLNPVYQKTINDFFDKQLSAGQITPFKNILYENIERWKKNYDSSRSQADVEDHWSNVSTGNTMFENVFDRMNVDTSLLELFSKIEYVFDWDGYISNSYHYIAEKISENLNPIVQHLNKENKCGGVLFTGRGFYFKPLGYAVQSSLTGIKGIDSDLFIDTGLNLKEVCMRGIFNRSIINHSDLISTPIEVKKDTTKRILKSDLKSNNLIRNIYKFFEIFTKYDGEYYSEDSNRIEVTNLDLLNCQFLAGGNRYIINRAVNVQIVGAHLIQSRTGIYMILSLNNVNTQIVRLYNDSSKDTGNAEDIYKSLFPGYLDPSLLTKKCKNS